MNRWVAFILLLAIVFGGWFLLANTGIATLFDVSNSPILFTYEGTVITLAWLFWAVFLFIVWVAVFVSLSTLDPFLGYLFLRFSVELIVIYGLRQKKFKMPE